VREPFRPSRPIRGAQAAPGARTQGTGGRPAPREPVALGDALRRFLRASGLSEHARHFTIFAAWDEVLGVQLARRARPVAFQAGTLSIEVESAAHLHELQNFTGEQYRSLANTRLGKTEIRKVVFRLKR
jgi:predicted nucleic acid-binding Zn ribbon protein